jgi:hypothetical protein
LVHRWATGKFRLTKFTMARTWGKPPPSPLQYTLWLAMGLASKWHLSRDSQVGVPKNPKVKIIASLGAHNFVYRPPIEMRFETKLCPSLRAFQRYVAHHLHARKSGWFPTFLLAITCVSSVEMGAHFRHLRSKSFPMI